ncbi:phosphoglycerate mutase [Leptolyngbya sp. Heron Island J]|uniref:histidine phosphatase family protein n=1 Tax=Leptolyngbya sp. Heron Island J TaxID=1385935 RepID=UPI0003B96F1F|nr:histidine phosphatase family protein [Leptolyngbya sp. Heron Island J]ESA35898.1 phosphoglycerate mutase [Leptolyngbya sp. Heron Island J]
MADYLKLLLIRHAESVGNIDGRLEGQMSTSLSRNGQWQTAQLANYLYQHQPPPTCLYSSPLQRATETAQPLALRIGCPLRLDMGLQELHQGIFQGLTWAEASHRYPQICAALITTLDYQPVPEAETPMAAHQRAVIWGQMLWQRHGPGDSVWMVTHGGFMQSLIRVILGCDRTWQIPIRHTAMFEFWLLHPDCTDGSQNNPEYWKILKFNETPHLQLKA